MSEELRPSEVARRSGASIRTVQRWIATGRLPARRVGGRYRVASDAFDAFMGTEGPGVAMAAGSPGTPARDGESPHPLHAPIRRLLIANRGEIARRIARTCDRLGVAAIVPPTDGPTALDLLDGPAVVKAAERAGADALHPGFGFLAERADFAEAVQGAGIVWVGPPPAAIRAMGDKAAARRLAASLGVPTPAGYDDADQSDQALLAAAERIGLPLLVKPAAGGGGKGMRTVRDAARLPTELAAARREAMTAFGDDRLILERLVEGARHIEIQVLFDAHGHGVHLGERDCSTQRRHQKVLEESPSPAIDAPTRAELGASAIALAAAVGYVGAGTCEFLVDARGRATFLEMNTRLQVEHPVTELVTGRDLVADQLRIAAGEPIDLMQEDITLAGHAIEVRLYAEDAEDGFLPATGQVEHLRWPSGDGIRVDAGVDEGDEVTGRFDPMLAKIIARGEDRTDAIDRLTRALDATVVLGLTTNLRFLRWLVRHPAVREGQVRTDTLERIWPPDDWSERTAIPDEAWQRAAGLLAGEAGPWSGGWRLNGAPTIRLEAADAVRSVPVTSRAAAEGAGGGEKAAEGAGDGESAADTAGDGEKAGEKAGEGAGQSAAVRVGDTVHLDLAGRSVAFRLAAPPDVDRAARAAARSHGTGPAELTAPMPSRIVAVHRASGDVVATGDPVVTLEAMKMEHTVTSPIDGQVADVSASLGDQVVRGQVLAVIDAAP